MQLVLSKSTGTLKKRHQVALLTGVRLWMALVVLAIIWGGGQRADAAEVTAYVDRTQISAGESVSLTVSIKDGKGDVDVSGIKDFKVLSRGTSSNISIINGSMTRETRSNFTLIPLKAGRLTIPPLPVISGGKAYHTPSITVSVLASEQQSPDRADADLFLDASVSNHKPYVGEPITFTLRVFNRVRIANTRFQPPEFKGFDEKKVDDDKTYTRVVQSKQYNVIELTYVLTPVSEGRHTVTPAVLSCDVAQKTSQRGNRFDPFFNDPFFSNTRYVPRTVSSKAIEIDVRPLPPYTGDTPFSGLVGLFELDAAIDKASARVGDSLTLSVTLNGSGNILDATDPAVNVPDTFKVYKDAPEEKITFDPTGYSGEKTFRWALVPIKPGDVVMPGVSYVYFDVRERQYKTLKTAPLQLAILPSDEKKTGLEQPLPAPFDLPKFEKKQVAMTGHDILPLKEDMDAVEPYDRMVWSVFLGWLLLPAGGYGLLLLYLRFRQQTANDKTVMIRRANKALSSAKGRQSDAELLSALYTALVSTVFAVSGSRGEALTGREMCRIFDEKGVAPEDRDHAVQLLERIESARYSGDKLTEADKTTLYTSTQKMVRRLL